MQITWTQYQALVAKIEAATAPPLELIGMKDAADSTHVYDGKTLSEQQNYVIDELGIETDGDTGKTFDCEINVENLTTRGISGWVESSVIVEQYGL
jgi:hypothetical protein